MITIIKREARKAFPRADTTEQAVDAFLLTPAGRKFYEKYLEAGR